MEATSPPYPLDVQTRLAEWRRRPLQEGRSWQDTKEFHNELVEGVDCLCRTQQGLDLVSKLMRARSEGTPEDADQVLSEPVRMQLLDGQVLHEILPAGFNVATVMEVVADRQSERLADDDPDAGVHTSQVRVSADARVLRPTDALPEDIGGVVDVVIMSQTWRDKAIELPEQIRSVIEEWSQKDDGDDRTWGDCGEFAQIVEAVSKLCKAEQHRGGGSNSDSELDEIMEVLNEAVASPNACPAFVLKQLVEVFGA